jgi:hypothetical protein
VPLTDLAVAALREQVQFAGQSPYLFPSENAVGHQTTFKRVWRLTLRRAKVPYFRIYDLRWTYATPSSAGGGGGRVRDAALRQGDAKVFKKYSLLQMKREALAKAQSDGQRIGGRFGTGGMMSREFWNPELVLRQFWYSFRRESEKPRTGELQKLR